MPTFTFAVTHRYSTEAKTYMIKSEDDRQAWDEVLDAVENDGQDLDMTVQVTEIEDDEEEGEDV